LKSPSVPLYLGRIEGKIYKRGNGRGICKMGKIGGMEEKVEKGEYPPAHPPQEGEI